LPLFLTLVSGKLIDMAKQKMIVFDLMGTFFREGHVISRLLTPLAKKAGLNVSYQELKEAYLKYTEGKMGAEEFHKVVPTTIEKEFLDMIKSSHDMFPVIKYLQKKGYRLGVLSNFPEEWGDYLEEKFNFKEYFDPIVITGEHHVKKPSSEIYNIFVEQAGVDPAYCWFVDDKLENLQVAEDLEMKTIWFKREGPKVNFKPDHIIMKANDLKKIF
jgi:HAD superfamily hydrolase (TIGR01509 family)